MGESFKHKVNRIMTIGKIKKHGLKGEKCQGCGWRVISSETSLTCTKCKGAYEQPKSIKERISSMKRFKEDGNTEG